MRTQTKPKPDKRTAILDAAETRARTGGYNGFSFRDLAEDVGIKSASVHYHFPTKEALGAALTERYTMRAIESLGDPAGLNELEAFDRVAALFVHANEVEDLMCLCGLFGAETAGLPEPLVAEVKAYFEALTSWLSDALQGQNSVLHAEMIVATLEGALIMSRTSADKDLLRRLQARLRETIA
ncbi:MAG: TetR/AcrR family transcriptional regulator [Pseudomonadota bacterium]